MPAGLHGTVRIGITYAQQLAVVYAAFGAKGSASNATDESVGAYLKPIVDDINAHGGIGGRKLEIVLAGMDVTQNFDDLAQQACAKFTEDEHVFAVIHAAPVPVETMAACVAGHKTPIVWEFRFLWDNAGMKRYAPYLYNPASFTAERQGFYVDGLYSAGFFGKDAKVGIFRPDEAIHQRFVDRVLKPRLAAHKIPVVAEGSTTRFSGVSDAGAMTAQASNAALRFRSAGVTHVLFSPTSGVISNFFISQADGQGYRPRYGFISLDNPRYNATQDTQAALKGAMGIGSSPTDDLRFLRDVPKGNGPRDGCITKTRKLLGEGAINAVPMCDGLHFLKAALDRSRSFTASGLRTGVDVLGTSWTSSYALGPTKFGPGRYDGAAATRVIAYNAGCSCFKYASPITSVP